MQVMTLEAEVDAHGFVHLDLPVDLPPGRVEVEVKIQPRRIHHKNGTAKKTIRSQQELWAEFERLTRIAFQGVTWEEIKEGRRDDENRY